MKQAMLCVLATAAAVTGSSNAPCLAAGGDEWARLDQELDLLLARSAQAPSAGPIIHGLLRTRWAYLPEVLPGNEDFNGFSIDRAQLVIEGPVGGDYGYRLQLEAAGGTAQLLDAYGTWQAHERVRVSMGRFRSPLMWESQLDDSDLLFLTRTDSGELFYGRDEGAMLDGSFDRFHWKLALQNGFDTVADDYAFTARIGFDAIGGGVGLHQGAYGSGGETHLTVGAGYFDDRGVGSGNDGSVWTADAQLQAGRFAADAMITDYGDDNDVIFVNRSNSRPWAVTGAWMLVEDRWEVAARYQDTDNLLDEKDITLGANYYVQGHDVKWQLTAVNITSDDDDLDDTWRFGVGLNVRI